MYKIPCKPEGELMTERWVIGTWLGKRALSEKCACLRPFVCCPTQRAGVWTASTISSEHPGS